jgi:benzodiazapine receptor
MISRRDTVSLLVAVLSVEAVGGASALVAGGDFRAYFDSLRKPPLTPPPAAFGPAWTTLYLLMGIAVWLIWRRRIDERTAAALGLFVAQLVLNAMWSIVFFGRHKAGWALLEIVLLWMTILATILSFWRLRPLAGALLLPYLAWVSFATYLNAGIWRLNRGAEGPAV